MKNKMLASNAITNTIYDLNTINSYESIYYNPYTYVTSTTCSPAKVGLEINPNELKINIKKTPIKFNFNL